MHLAVQDIIQLKLVEITIAKPNKKRATRTLAFVTPRPNLPTYRANGYLENKFIAQLKHQTNANQAPIYWGSLSVYELVFNLYEKPIYSPNQWLLKKIVDDAIARSWAEPIAVKGFVAKIQTVNVILWRLSTFHDSKIVAERKTLSNFCQTTQGEYKEFFVDVETAVKKAIYARRRKSN
jgi:hypothetical protein